ALVFTAVICVATALTVGLVPSLLASAADPQLALSDGGRSASPGRGRLRLRGLLVSAEMALALTMLAGTIVTVRGFRALASVAPGYRVDHALTMQLTAPFARYGTTTDVERMYGQLLAAVRAEPEVVDAALTTSLPPEFLDDDARIYLEGERKPTRGEPARRPRWQKVTPGYFATMDIPLVSGRAFTEHDDSTTARVMVINESMARAYWPNAAPIGKRVGCACDDTTLSTVVGVVADVRYNPNVGPTTAPTY